MFSGSPARPRHQRTSSVDIRRDYNAQTWTSLIQLLRFREFFVTVDHFSAWKRHLVWAKCDGKDLRDHMTQRFSSCMIFMSLLLGIEVSTLNNSSQICTSMRHALQEELHHTLRFWTGIAIIISAVLTLLGLLSVFTAWTMVSAVNEANAHCVFRSSIGQYVVNLPGRFMVGAIYSFLIWLSMYIFMLIPVGPVSLFLFASIVVLFLHTVAVFSAFGRIVMHTGAMGNKKVFDPQYEAMLLPHGLHKHLLMKARASLASNISIVRLYRGQHKPIDRRMTEDELVTNLSDRTTNWGLVVAPSWEVSDGLPPTTTRQKQPPEAPPQHKRKPSAVLFSDGFNTTGDYVPPNMRTPPVQTRKHAGSGLYGVLEDSPRRRNASSPLTHHPTRVLSVPQDRHPEWPPDHDDDDDNDTAPTMSTSPDDNDKIAASLFQSFLQTPSKAMAGSSSSLATVDDAWSTAFSNLTAHSRHSSTTSCQTAPHNRASSFGPMVVFDMEGVQEERSSEISPASSEQLSTERSCLLHQLENGTYEATGNHEACE